MGSGLLGQLRLVKLCNVAVGWVLAVRVSRCSAWYGAIRSGEAVLVGCSVLSFGMVGSGSLRFGS